MLRRPHLFRALQALIGIAFSVLPSRAQSIDSLAFTPGVLSHGTTAPLLIEVTMTAAATLTVDFSPAGTATTSIPLRDDGAEGDRAAGDRTYSARLAVAPILAALTADDVNRVFIGYLNVASGGTAVSRANLFVDVYTPDIGVYPVTRLTQFVQATTRVVNIHDAAYITSGNIGTITREFYRHFPDNYDVINVVLEPQRFENRTHGVIKNTVTGIGIPISDSSAAHGSGGRLIGISRFPIPRFFDGAETGFIHELGHQWSSYVRGPFAAASPHWPYSTMANGVMGFSIGGAGGQGGSFPCEITEDPRGFLLTPRVGAPAFNDVDLYLMGLMPAGEVRPQFVFSDHLTTPRCDGSIFTGAMTRVTIDDIIRSAGARVPGFGQAPTNFRLATIIVSRDGLLSQEMMSLYSWMAERAEWRTRVPTHSGFLKELGRPFFVATGGRGTVQMDIDVRRPDFAVAPATPSATVTRGTDARYEIEVVSRRSALDSPVTLSCDALPANATCRFEAAAVTPGANGQRTVMTVSTAAVPAGTHVVMVAGRNGDDRHVTAVTLIVQ